MSRRGKDINADEEGLWDLVTADVTPLKGRKGPVPEKTGETGAPRTGDMRAAPRPATSAPEGPKARDLDLRTDKKLTRGQMEIEAVLDLHGYGQTQAYENLCRFIEGAYAKDLRCILVITGKGKGGEGILRSRLPQWIDEAPLNVIVLKATQARQRDGGSGAFYILLRRRRAAQNRVEK
jgi:DNA-nicking Smr family endonuclease